MQTKKWHLKEIPEADSIRYLANALNISEAIAQILIQRNIHDASQAKRFLKPDIKNLLAPGLIPGLSAAHKRIEQALLNNEKIIIYGDYDVDGITSSSLVLTAMLPLGANINFFLPNRARDGYGLSVKVVERAAENGYKIISAGTSAIYGSPASGTSIEIMKGKNVDINGHRSQPVTLSMLEEADEIYVMTNGHLATLKEWMPLISKRIKLLDPAGNDIEDPIMTGREGYQKCASKIQKALEKIIC